jgi:hypothetical protein
MWEPDQETTTIGAQWTYNDGASFPDPTTGMRKLS